MTARVTAVPHGFDVPDHCLWHGFAIRVGTPDQNPETAASLFERALADIPEEAGDLEIVPQSEGGRAEILDFYDLDSDELVVVVRALYRKKSPAQGKRGRG